MSCTSYIYVVTDNIYFKTKITAYKAIATWRYISAFTLVIITTAISAYPINPSLSIKFLSNSICYPQFLVFALAWFSNSCGQSASSLSQDVLDLL